MTAVMKKVGIETKTKVLLHNQIVRPIISYGFPIWATINKTAYLTIEKMERKMMRAITGKYKKPTTEGRRWISERILRKETGKTHII